ncbi:MAG TPA: hypothetical protein ENF67_00780 [Candidatus Pacearchaeota archaeon]|nr:hypothetical protein [Candidatus Pacearchaeota archaeon]
MDREKLQAIARKYYRRKEIKKILLSQAKNVEVVAKYFDKFGKRPDILEYESDIDNLVSKGATSFHCSEELWQNPLELSTELKQDQLDRLRIGWNLILDVDCKFLEYSKIAAWLLCQALYFHGIRNFGLKFSGGTGWHIGIAFDAFPSEINKKKIKNFFPEGPRMIAGYLKDMIKKELSLRILENSSLKEIAEATGKKIDELLDKNKEFDPFNVLEIDTILISPRHLYRMAYSLHEKTGLASIVIKPEQIKLFHPSWAKPSRVYAKPFLPEPEPNEAKELLTQAFDWKAKKERKIELRKKTEEKGKIKSMKIKKIDERILPPCIKEILSGMKYDGRKRALFILITFLRSIGLDFDEIENKIREWNKLNYKPLKESYIVTQLNWFKKQSLRLPPNCGFAYYQDLGICKPDSLCQKIKNPLAYVMKKSKILVKEKGKERGRKK